MNDDRKRSAGITMKKGKWHSRLIYTLRHDRVALFAMIVFLVCMVILAVILVRTIEAKYNHNKISGIYKAENVIVTRVITEAKLTEAAASETVASSETAVNTEVSESSTETEYVTENTVMLDGAMLLSEINPDTVGYISIPGVVDEVIVQASDNSYYLEHNFYDAKRQCGTIFADHRNVVNADTRSQSDNIILYGHNERNGTMFGNLDYYRWHADYWLKNPFIYYNNNFSEYTYVIISSFVTNIDPEHDNGNVFEYWNYIDLNKNNFREWSEEIDARSVFITGIDYDENDKFLTLSTCSTEWEPSRHVIVARRLRENERAETMDMSKFQVNASPKWPAVYYKYGRK